MNKSIYYFIKCIAEHNLDDGDMRTKKQSGNIIIFQLKYNAIN